MKLTNRAKSALATAGYAVNEPSAIAQLVAFAAQNSGIEPRNYFDVGFQVATETYRQGVRAFKSEQRSISEDWRRFKAALNDAASVGVTDAEVIAEAPHAFGGRLEWIGKDYLREKHGVSTDYTPQWNYCVGQYFPTEYRKAAATLLEYAARRVRQARTPEKRAVKSIAELKALNAANGGCWFEPATMRFFRTRIESAVIRGRYFITSEQQDDDTPRNFTVRSFDATGDVDTVGEFHAHKTKADALEALREHLNPQTMNA